MPVSHHLDLPLVKPVIFKDSPSTIAYKKRLARDKAFSNEQERLWLSGMPEAEFDAWCRRYGRPKRRRILPKEAVA